MQFEGKKRSIDKGRAFFMLISIFVSSFFTYSFFDVISENKDGIIAIITIFSILAGFLLAVMSFVVDPILSRTDDWKHLKKIKPTIDAQLFRYKLVFYLYLSCLALALIVLILPSNKACWVDFFAIPFLWLASFVFMLSFSLPSSLAKIQFQRYNAALERNKPTLLNKKR